MVPTFWPGSARQCQLEGVPAGGSGCAFVPPSLPELKSPIGAAQAAGAGGWGVVTPVGRRLTTACDRLTQDGRPGPRADGAQELVLEGLAGDSRVPLAAVAAHHTILGTIF